MNKKTNEMHEAAAIKYAPETDRAPTIVAVGKGELADKLIEKAEQNNVPVYKDPQLARTLNLFNPGDEIPPELYEVVADILVFLANIDKNYGEKFK